MYSARCDDVYQDEDPSPAIITVNPFHVCDPPSEHTAESTCHSSCAEKQGDTEVAFVAFVLEGQIEHDAWE